MPYGGGPLSIHCEWCTLMIGEQLSWMLTANVAREQLFNMVWGVRKIWWDFFRPMRRGEYFFRPWMGGWMNFVHASLANIVTVHGLQRPLVCDLHLENTAVYKKNALYRILITFITAFLLQPTPCHYFIKMLNDRGLLKRHYTQVRTYQ